MSLLRYLRLPERIDLHGPPNNLLEPLGLQMVPGTHRLADSCESREIGLFGRQEGKPPEMWDDRGEQGFDVLHFVI